MASSQDTEITLGTGKLLVLFFGLVGVCALFLRIGIFAGAQVGTCDHHGQRRRHAANRAGNTSKASSGTSTSRAHDVLQVGRAEGREP